MITTLTFSKGSLRPLVIEDAPFVFELLNTQQWIQNIGDRQILSLAHAEAYIHKINDNSQAHYHVIANEWGRPVGIITLLQRDFLPGPDLGFALLPAYMGIGMGHHAANTYIDFLRKSKDVSVLYAIAKPENIRSLKLLQRLGFSALQPIYQQEQKIHLYSLHIA